MSSQALRERWSWDGNAFAVKKAGISLLQGQPQSAGYLYHRFHFSHDDFLELNLALQIAADSAATQTGNLLMVQLAPLQTRYDSHNGPAAMVFSGLCVMLLGGGTGREGRYFVTYRFFHKETALSQAYLELLADRRESVQSCELPDIAAVTSMQLQLDFEGANRLEVSFEQGGRRVSCFAADGLMQYIPAQAFYLSVKARSAEGGFSAVLTGLSAREKAHSLDVDEQLSVSHGLVEEIFDKVGLFTQRLNADAAGLRGVAELQTAVLDRADRLEAYAQDLFFGTKRFQEFMLETLSEHRVFSPENLPKMEMIRNKVEELNAKQQEFYDLFTALRGLLATRKLFERTQKQLQRVQEQIHAISNVVRSPQFAEMLAHSQQMMTPLKNLTFSTMLGSVLSFEPEKARSTRLLTLNLFIVLGTLALLALFGLLILRKVGSFEVSQLT